MEEIRLALAECFNERLKLLTLSGKKNKGGVWLPEMAEHDELSAREMASKVRLRPVMKKDGLRFQAEEFVEVASGTGSKVFHRNLTAEQAVLYIEASMEAGFVQCQIQTDSKLVTVLRNQKGHVNITTKQKEQDAELAVKRKEQDGNFDAKKERQNVTLSHNREKQYILAEGEPIPFLVDLGVMTSGGQIVKAKYHKFRQLNRYLEFVRDVLPALPRDREVTVLDFGCGKSYLTFALYYYLVEKMGYDVCIIGLDLKEDVIARCNELAEKYGYDKLRFLLGDIAGYTGHNQVDMVVTLHACDTATDFALAKAVEWNARVILSVPCCQHELNRQIKSELLAPVLKYGLLKERMAALLTDGIRAGLLEEEGYEVQVMEFIELEHTPKNVLIRAVKKGKRMVPQAKAGGSDRLEAMLRELNAEPSLEKLLGNKCVETSNTPENKKG